MMTFGKFAIAAALAVGAASPALADTLIYKQSGLELEIKKGAFESNDRRAQQLLTIKNKSSVAVNVAMVECGFFHGDLLIGRGSGSALQLEPGQDGYVNIHEYVLSADRTDCRFKLRAALIMTIITKLALAALVAASFTAPAHAEKWKYRDNCNGGRAACRLGPAPAAAKQPVKTLPASPQTEHQGNDRPVYDFMGAGALTCSKFADDFKKATAINIAVDLEDSYFTWAQGYMTAINEGRAFITKVNTKNLNGFSVANQKQLIRTYCDAHPLRNYADAVTDLFNSLPEIESAPPPKEIEERSAMQKDFDQLMSKDSYSDRAIEFK